MRNIKQTTTFICAMMTFFITQTSVGQRVVTTNSIFDEGGYTYEFWMDAGGGYGTMTTGPDGTFKGEWKDVFNILFRSGIRPGTLDKVITYSAVFEPYGERGTSYLTLYGWTRNPLVEYYVVESWWNWRPPGGTPIGTVESDGGIYDIYRADRVNKPSIDGVQTFPQFFSVRQVERTSGTITFANHVRAWKELGMHMGADLYEVSFCVEGFRNSGNSHVYELEFADGATTKASSDSHDNDASSNVSIYTHPTHSNVLNIKFESQPDSDAVINIYNSIGKVVKSITNVDSFNQLDITALNQGVFKVEVASPNHISNHMLVRR